MSVRHEDLNLIPRTHIKKQKTKQKPGVAIGDVIPDVEEEVVGSWGPVYSASKPPSKCHQKKVRGTAS